MSISRKRWFQDEDEAYDRIENKRAKISELKNEIKELEDKIAKKDIEINVLRSVVDDKDDEIDIKIGLVTDLRNSLLNPYDDL
jgi:peptidoglycan hydrolase CwlO-like protein